MSRMSSAHLYSTSAHAVCRLSVSITPYARFPCAYCFDCWSFPLLLSSAVFEIALLRVGVRTLIVAVFAPSCVLPLLLALFLI
ncbi:hypothetical protein PF005_g23935 [Phytophthora fragariae]|uniref:Uncharacterized protein n=1 Tax=Phytophthora fragariae TaxID=53985 RepID=A0A6A3FFH6_9STRA|nr:hypothetical protein PF003_g6802 [Phytophthora fragariae]KAE8943141.1 hypothetical protein PF009_g7135 [Phytophthora fragariae]KAE9089147.1 hypothetical protein PF007_g19702 [Phytophthora fragariae]KAE9150170.1 hypothetical protein PF006_g5431 [Phytophthora fragariae]KAE9178774.1 hypothetical protein PF005_g23935 [Phytophthora fragariae]